METLRKILIIVLLLPCFDGYGQNAFFKKYTGSAFDTGNGIAQLADSNYVITGSSGAFNEYSGQCYLMKTDKYGNQLWTKAYGGSGDDIGVRVLPLADNGFFIAGYTSSTDDGDYDFMLYRIDENGDLLWEKQYGTSDWEKLNDAILLSDGGVVMVGQTEGLHTQLSDIFMVRTDAQGDTLWTKTIATPENDVAYAVDTIGVNELIVAGGTGVNGEEYAMLGRYQVDGTEVWSNIYATQGESVFRAVGVYEDYIYAFGGYTADGERYSRWGVEVKENGEFNGEWADSEDIESMFTTMVIRDVNSMYLAFQTEDEALNVYPGGKDTHIHKYYTYMYYNDFSGNYSDTGDDFVNQMIVTLDDGIAIVGTAGRNSATNDSYHLGQEVFFAKLGPNDEYVEEPDAGNDLLTLQEEELGALNIYPNPTRGEIQIPEALIGAEYTLINAQGNVVQEGKLSTTLTLMKNVNGVYILQVYGEGSVWRGKIIKH